MHEGARNPESSNDLRASVSSNFRQSIWFIVLVALLLRLATIAIGHTYRITPRRDHFQFGWEMGRLARSIATGQGFSSPTDLPSGPSAWAPPLYPYILAGVFKLFGIYSNASAAVILAFNSIFAALTCVPLYEVADRMYGRGVARAAAWTWAVFPYAIYWPVRVVWETSLSAYLLSLALLMTLRMSGGKASRGAWIWFGLLWGLAALTNTALLSMAPLCCLWLLWKARNRSREFSMIIVSGLVAFAVISPWLVRNYRAFGSFVFIRDNLPLEMHMANNDRFTGLWTRNEHPGNDPVAMREFQQLGEYRFMQQKRDQFHEFVHQHPHELTLFSVERAAYFWIGTPQATIVNGYDFIVFRHMTFFLAAAFAFTGLWLTLRNRIPGGFLLACFLLIYPLPYYLVNPFPRYKHPIEPVMLLLIVYLLYESRRIQIRWPH